MSLRFAQVVAVHPERRTVDLVFFDNSAPAAEVNVMAGTIASDCGVWDMPNVAPPTAAAAVPMLSGGGRNLTAIVEFTAEGRPVVLGFLLPAGSQMTVKQQNRTINRHASGAYVTVAPDGSIEAFHPSGAYVRVGTGGHEDLAAISADGNWSIPASAPPAQVTVVTSGFVLTIEPGGKTTLASQGDANLAWKGDVTVQAGGNMAFVAGGDLSFRAEGETTVNSTGALSMTAPTIDLNP